MWQLWDNNTALPAYSAGVGLALDTCSALDTVLLLKLKKKKAKQSQLSGTAARRTGELIKMFYEESLEN